MSQKPPTKLKRPSGPAPAKSSTTFSQVGTEATTSSGPSTPVPGEVAKKRPVHVDAPVKAEEAQGAESKSPNVVDSMPTSELSLPANPEASESNETLGSNEGSTPTRASLDGGGGGGGGFVAPTQAHKVPKTAAQSKPVSRLPKSNLFSTTSLNQLLLAGSNLNVSQVDTSEKHNLKVGDRVIVSGNKRGTLRYVGTTQFAEGEWAGVELDEALGKNDGSVGGKRYFKCVPMFGLFAPVAKVTRLQTTTLTPQRLSTTSTSTSSRVPVSTLTASRERSGSQESISSLSSVTSSASRTRVRLGVTSLANQGTDNESANNNRADSNVNAVVTEIQPQPDTAESQDQPADSEDVYESPSGINFEDKYQDIEDDCQLEGNDLIRDIYFESNALQQSYEYSGIHSAVENSAITGESSEEFLEMGLLHQLNRNSRGISGIQLSNWIENQEALETDQFTDNSCQNQSNAACISSTKRAADRNEKGPLVKIPKLRSSEIPVPERSICIADFGSPFEKKNATENTELTSSASTSSETCDTDIFCKDSTSKAHWNLTYERNMIEKPVSFKQDESSCDDSVVYNDLEMPDVRDMKHILFLDVDNVPTFFDKMPFNLPDNTFIWMFQGGNNPWKTPTKNAVYVDAETRGLTHIQQKSGTTKNAADFDICTMVGYSHAHPDIPKSVPFTILSNDLAFHQVENLFKNNRRKVSVIKPRCHDKLMLYSMIKSITDGA